MNEPKRYQSFINPDPGATKEELFEAYPEVIESARSGRYITIPIQVSRKVGNVELVVHLMSSRERTLCTLLTTTLELIPAQFACFAALCLDALHNVKSPLTDKANRPKSLMPADVKEWFNSPIVKAWFDTVLDMPAPIHLNVFAIHGDMEMVFDMEVGATLAGPFVTKN